jgi:hypothetical protein
MGMKGRPTVGKRQKEQARRERQQRKEQERTQRRANRSTAEPDAPGEDPDIAGIVPGPQRSPWEE